MNRLSEREQIEEDIKDARRKRDGFFEAIDLLSAEAQNLEEEIENLRTRLQNLDEEGK